MRRTLAPGLKLLLLPLLAGCGLFGEDTPAVALSASTNTAVLQQGASQTISLDIARTKFEQPVTLSAEGSLPTGVTFSFAPNPITAGVSTASLTITASGSATPGTAALTVKANGEGISESAVLIDVTVNIRGSHTVGLSKSSVKVAQGGGGQSTVVLERTGNNAGMVTLTASGAPGGVTVAFAESPTTARGTSVTVNANGSVAPGSYDISISGSQPGLTPTPAPATLTIDVIVPPATSALSIPFCEDDLPVWFAHQNEGFLWEPVTASGNSFTFAATEKVSIAFAFEFGEFSDVRFYNATRSELEGLGVGCDGPKSHPGTVANVESGQTALVGLGGAFDVASGSSFLLEGVEDTDLDLVATRGNVLNGQFTADRMVIRRGVNLANSASIPVIDYTSAESVAPVTNVLTVNGVQSGESVYMENLFQASSRTIGVVGTSEGSSSSHVLRSAPASEVEAGDVHELYIDAFNASGTLAHSMLTYFDTPGDRTETLGAALSSPTISTTLVAPYLRERAQLTSQSDYPTAARFVYLQGNVAPKFVVVVTTAAYLGATPVASWDVTVPDLSEVAGFDTEWMHTAGPTITYSAEAFSGPGVVLFGGAASAGQTVRFAYRESSVASAASPALRMAGPRRRSIADGRRGLLDLKPQYLRR